MGVVGMIPGGGVASKGMKAGVKTGTKLAKVGAKAAKAAKAAKSAKSLKNYGKLAKVLPGGAKTIVRARPGVATRFFTKTANLGKRGYKSASRGFKSVQKAFIPIKKSAPWRKVSQIGKKLTKWERKTFPKLYDFSRKVGVGIGKNTYLRNAYRTYQTVKNPYKAYKLATAIANAESNGKYKYLSLKNYFRDAIHFRKYNPNTGRRDLKYLN